MDRGTEFDVREALGCTCMRLRRANRQITQLYDRHLAPTGLTSSQFGLLARLQGASLQGKPALPIGILAELHGMDPTTLTRNLKLLLDAKLVRSGRDDSDRRVRTVSLTDAGRKRLLQAAPEWRKAQQAVETALGTEATLALNGLLDLSNAKLPA
ncbi:MarR family winged helix-turn-helix transcriptional regulator [Bradyrhizobium erythrophlei]|uniref:MarR family winged helix-turn-helix transcriptional regulator n=1 Tax=Bradyrhizobium erythrophlei TaxID=1437360 RepID=UPI0035E701A0